MTKHQRLAKHEATIAGAQAFVDAQRDGKSIGECNVAQAKAYRATLDRIKGQVKTEQTAWREAARATRERQRAALAARGEEWPKAQAAIREVWAQCGRAQAALKAQAMADVAAIHQAYRERTGAGRAATAKK